MLYAIKETIRTYKNIKIKNFCTANTIKKVKNDIEIGKIFRI